MTRLEGQVLVIFPAFLSFTRKIRIMKNIRTFLLTGLSVFTLNCCHSYAQELSPDTVSV
jgi:hypothetical protein